MRQLLLGIILVGAFTGSAAANERIDALFRSYDQARVPGASVLVIKSGEVFYQKAYGLARLNDIRMATTGTNYRLASLSKAFTAMAVVILKERGLIRYDDSLRQHIPEFPSYGENISIRHLLNHQSGLRDYEDYLPSGQQRQLTDEDVVKILTRRTSVYFRPGSQYRYSNAGYATLAAIVARVAQVPFQDFLKEHIFLPLAMNQTVAFVDGYNEVSQRAFGYTRRGSRFDFSDQSLTSAVLGDGGVYSSIEDLFAWDQAFYDDNGVVSNESLQEILTPGILNDGRSTEYGFGWVLDRYRGYARQSHTGSTIGQRHAIQRLPSEELTVVVLINRANVSPWTLAAQIIDQMLEGAKD